MKEQLESSIHKKASYTHLWFAKHNLQLQGISELICIQLSRSVLLQTWSIPGRMLTDSIGG